MEIRINKNESTSARRRLYFQCYDATDGITPETGEAGGQPQISRDGSSWTSTGIGTLVDIGNGRYYADLTQAATNYDNAIILSRYKSVNTSETIGSTGIVDSALIDLVWDETLTASTHNVPTSAGRRLRQIAGTIVIDGIAQGAGTNGNQIILDSDASSMNGAYDPAVIGIISGTGAGQCRLILEYTGSTRTATVDRTWKVNPSTDSEYIIYADPGREHVNEGLAQAGGTNTITLNSSASSIDNEYVGQTVFIRSGQGEDQACKIISYNGTTKVATIGKNWGVVPNGTSAYVMLPTGVLDTQTFGSTIVSGVWNNSVRTLTSGSGGGATASDVWSYPTRSITSAEGVASSVWGYESRTLTNWRNIVTDIWNAVPQWFLKKVEQMNESDYYLYRGVDNSLSFISSGNVSGSSNIVFSIKNNYSDLDENSILRIEFRNGLIILNGGQYPSSLDGSITIIDETNGDFEITLSSTASKLLIPSQKRLYDIKAKIGNEVRLIARGKIDILPDVTNSV